MSFQNRRGFGFLHPSLSDDNFGLVRLTLLQTELTALPRYDFEDAHCREEMHFSKTYTQLLVSLPPELRDNAFDYRRLKQLINRTVSELDSLGIGPSVIRSFHDQDHSKEESVHVERRDEALAVHTEGVSAAAHKLTVVYEIVLKSSVLEPRLRLSSTCPSDTVVLNANPSTAQPVYHVDLLIPEQSVGCITRALLHPPVIVEGEPLLNPFMASDHPSDLIIPLPSDTEFFQLLTSTLNSLFDHGDALQEGFNSALTTLATSISMTARPASSSAPHSFSAYSLTAGNVATLRPSPGGRSDLYIWREIFRIYAEAEVFESVNESTRRERSVEEAEELLQLFRGRVQDKKESLTFPGSREAVDVFVKLNLFILDVKKLQLANSEATRKILKKHAKRTTFSIPFYLLEPNASTSMACTSRQVSLTTRPWSSLPRLLVQAIGEVLLPVVPHIDDYACLICTSIAFKPIRLDCNHFFCVRCLVKMQKRRMPNCPMCRAPAVLQANPSNIDYGLLNFMADWFPIESREKLRANEQEVTQEQLETLGIADVRICRIM